MLIVVFILTDVIFFCATFMLTDKIIKRMAEDGDYTRVVPWIMCLVSSQKATDECSHLGQNVILRESTLLAVLCLLSLAGTQAFLLLFRHTMITGWYDFFRNKFGPSDDFASVDAKRASSRASNPSHPASPPNPFELSRVSSKEPLMQGRMSPNKPSPYVIEIQSFGATLPWSEVAEEQLTPQRTATRDFAISPTEPLPPEDHHRSSSRGASPDYSREYRSPNHSFSAPQTPNQVMRRSKEQEWDPRVAMASDSGGDGPVSPLSPTGGRNNEFDMMMRRL